MSRFLTVVFASVLVAVLCVPAFAVVTFAAFGTTTSPPQNHEYHTGGAPTANVSPVCVNVEIRITGASAYQMFNLSWNMVAHVNDTPVSGDVNDTIITCTQQGYWSRLAKGTGTLMGTMAVAPAQNGFAGTYASFYNVGDPSQNATRTDNRNFKVVNP